MTEIDQDEDEQASEKCTAKGCSGTVSIVPSEAGECTELCSHCGKEKTPPVKTGWE